MCESEACRRIANEIANMNIGNSQAGRSNGRTGNSLSVLLPISLSLEARVETTSTSNNSITSNPTTSTGTASSFSSWLYSFEKTITASDEDAFANRYAITADESQKLYE